jgi:hypothetical protein
MSVGSTSVSRLKYAALAASFGLLFITSAAHAGNVAVATANGNQVAPLLVGDDSGGAILTWTDSRAALDTRVQHLTPAGIADPAWPKEGCVLYGGIGWYSTMIPDGTGGAIVMRWVDGQGLVVQHVLASGRVDLAWPVDGMTLTDRRIAGDAMVGDGAGGALIAWSERRATDDDYDVYALRVKRNGRKDPHWATNLVVCRAPGNQWSLSMTPDGSGGAFLTWEDGRAGRHIGPQPFTDVYAQHITRDGTLAPGWPTDGILVCATQGHQYESRIVTDGDQGAIVAWCACDDNGNGKGVFARHLVVAGVDPSWSLDGDEVPGARNGTAIQMVTDSAGGAVIAVLGRNLYVRHLLATGVMDPGWPPYAVAICDAPGDKAYPAMVEDGAGGALITWQDLRNGRDYDIYAQHVLASGSADPSWPANGRALCSATRHQYIPALAPSLDGEFIVAWQDDRNDVANDDGNWDIYAQTVATNGALVAPPVALTMTVGPNPVRAKPLLVSFVLPNSERGRLECLDITGRLVAERDLSGLGAGRHMVVLAETTNLAAGMYLIRIEQGGASRSIRAAVLR